MSEKFRIQFKTTDHYSNILLVAPDEQALAIISIKRARWYKKKKLAQVVQNRDGYSEVLKMLAEPAVRPAKAPVPLTNQCVVCGKKLELSAHHVLPRVIRTCFSMDEKNHSFWWIVLVCELHHLAAEKLARSLYEKQLQTAVEDARKLHSHNYLDLIKSAILRADYAKLSIFRDERAEKVKKAHQDCVEKIIQQYGGVKKTKKLFKLKFLELKPLYLPEGFLTDA